MDLSTLPPPPPRPDPAPTGTSATRAGARPRWRDAPAARVPASLIVGGVALATAFQHQVSVVTTLAVTAAVVAVARAGAPVGVGRVALAAAVVPAILLSWRSSPWLVGVNLLAIAGLVAVSAALRAEPRPVTAALVRLVSPATVFPPVFLAGRFATHAVEIEPDRLDRWRQRFASALLVLAAAGPVVGLLAWLLASGDAVFGSFVSPPTPSGTWLAQPVWIAAGGLVVLAVLSVHRWHFEPFERPRTAQLSTHVVAGVLGGMILTYAAFAAALLTAAVGGDDYVLQTTGLTYAEYARTGFFQLLGAATLTVVVLLGLRALTAHLVEGPAQAVRRLSLVVVGLALVPVAVSIWRLDLYENVFGLTMLRLFSTLFAGWLGVVLVLVGLRIGGWLRCELPLAVLASALAAVVLVNVVNPEAMVARRNLANDAVPLDLDYLEHRLGDDALPVLAASNRVPDTVVCARAERSGAGLLTVTWSRWRADRAVDDRCG